MRIIERIKETFIKVWKEFEQKSVDQFGFRPQDVTFSKLTTYLHEPKCTSSLAVTRILFGLAMFFDVADERGGASMTSRWGDPLICHFPLIPYIQPLSMPYMALVYAALWLGALGIMLGYKYKTSSVTFATCYWYLFLCEKSYWNNHSYLFGLVSVLLACTDAGCYWSLDVYLDTKKKKETVPYWNYFILKYQFFILYFLAGVKKGTAEWLTGYSVQKLSEHWVFAPFRLFLTVSQTDYLVVHWFIFWFDLTIAVWMMWARTRHVAMIFCALFHLMNSRLFAIGMFPWVCLATMPLFYPCDWPMSFAKNVYLRLECLKKNLETKMYAHSEIDNEEINADINTDDHSEETNGNNDIQNELEDHKSKKKHSVDDDSKISKLTDFSPSSYTNNNLNKQITVYFIIFYMAAQLFLPFSHFITKGYNNWTNGLYGYSWDMMVHTWDPHSTVVKVVDNDKNSEFFLSPHTFAPNDRWSRHGDMVYQYAHCLNDKIKESSSKWNNQKIPSNISIYFDIWCSLNGRFTQRMFDPKVDILTARWSPFEPIPYLMPVMDEALNWRTKLDEIEEDVHSWNEYSDVTFYADFPGYAQEKFISKELRNVTIIVLEGSVAFEPQISENYIGQSMKLVPGEPILVKSGIFHSILNIGASPAYYMYTFLNNTQTVIEQPTSIKPYLPIFSEFMRRLKKMLDLMKVITKSINHILFQLIQCLI